VKKRRSGVFVLAFALLFIGAIPAWALGAPSWSTPVDVSVLSPQAGAPQIVAAADGSLTAVWQGFDGVNSIVQTSHSANRGATWGATTNLSAPGQNASFPHVAIAPNGSVTVLWDRFNGSAFTVETSHSVDGSGWSAPVLLAVVGGEASNPQVLVAPNGTISGVWQSFIGGNNVIETRHSVDGLSWSAPVVLSAAGGAASSPQIAAAHDSSLTAVWYRFDGSYYIVQSAHSADGSAWSVPTDLSAAGQNAIGPQIAAEPTGGLTVVWNRFDGLHYVIQATHSADSAATWAVPVSLSVAGQDADAPQLAAAPDGTFAVVWDRFDGSNFVIQSSHSAGGTTWSAAANLSTAGQNAVGPQIIAGPDSALTAIWSRYDGSNNIVQASHSADDGGTWDAPVSLSTAGQTADAPQVAVAADGAVSAVWSRFDGSNHAIQAAFTLTPPAIVSVALPIAPGHAARMPTAATATPAPPTPQPTDPPIVSPVLQLVFGFMVGDHANGGALTVKGDGFLPDSLVIVTLHSTPTTLGTIAISPGGTFEQALSLPTTVDPGAHHVDVTYTGSDGIATSQSWYFRVDDSNVVTKIQSQPTAMPPSWAQSAGRAPANPGTIAVGGVTYQRYLPSLHPAQAVDTVVSSLVLLTILGGVGAASAFAAGGSMAMAGSAAAAGSARGSSSHRSGENKGASLASAKVAHLKFKQEAVARGDRSSTWAWFGSQRLDSLSFALPVTLNRFSPLLARVSNDGAYLRAMFGPLWLVSSLAGIVLGALSLVNTHGAAVPPAVGLMIAIIVLSAFDVLGGFLAASTFTIGVIALGGLSTMAEVRTVLGIDVIFFTVALAASAARPLRRVPAQSASDWFDRTADVVIASLIGSWAVMKMIGSLPGLSGLELPIAGSAGTIALVAGAAIVMRYVLETVATYLYPLRLAAVTPPKIGFPSPWQQVVSAMLKTALFVFVAIAYLGNVWPLWVGAALFLIPSVIAPFQGKLPNVPRLVRLIPGGVFKIVLMLCVGKLLGGWLASNIRNPQDLIDQAFVVLAIPSLLLGFAGFFGREGNRWGLNWPMRIGGVVLVGLGVLLVLGVIRIP
jgi:hypothetical protein